MMPFRHSMATVVRPLVLSAPAHFIESSAAPRDTSSVQRIQVNEHMPHYSLLADSIDSDSHFIFAPKRCWMTGMDAGNVNHVTAGDSRTC